MSDDGVASRASTDTTVRNIGCPVACDGTSNASVLDVPRDATEGAETGALVSVGASRATEWAAGRRAAELLGHFAAGGVEV
jgi:hypothetical protein